MDTVDELVAALKHARTVSAALPCDAVADALVGRAIRNARHEPARKLAKRTAP